MSETQTSPHKLTSSPSPTITTTTTTLSESESPDKLTSSSPSPTTSPISEPKSSDKLTSNSPSPTTSNSSEFESPRKVWQCCKSPHKDKVPSPSSPSYYTSTSKFCKSPNKDKLTSPISPCFTTTSKTCNSPHKISITSPRCTITALIKLWVIRYHPFFYFTPPKTHPATAAIAGWMSTAYVTVALTLFFISTHVPHHHAAPDHPPALTPLALRAGALANATKVEREFWQQPDGQGYRPCIEFGEAYWKASEKVVRERRRVVVAVVSGGLNQQRHQIVDAVVIARILGAALALPVLRRNVIWGDSSGFSDIFDVDHFKHTLQSDVHIITSHTVSHRSHSAASLPFNVSPHWIHAKFKRQLDKEGILVLKGLDSKLSKDLPLDLQKLRCKVAFHALRFAAPIKELGDKLARRMWEGGPYIAVHLRLEKDVWVRTGCLPGLGPHYNEVVFDERESHPELLTGRVSLTDNHRRIAGLCPMNGHEVARLLQGLGAPKSARIYLAGGEPLGGDQALVPLAAEFPNLITKEMLAFDSELAPYVNKSSILAALDFIVSMSSNVFMPSHGGNMARAMQGHRAYAGHQKFVKPNKQAVVQLLAEEMSDAELSSALKQVHKDTLGQPEIRKTGADVLAYPVPECMCKTKARLF